MSNIENIIKEADIQYKTKEEMIDLLGHIKIY